MVNYRQKRILLKSVEGEIINLESDRYECPTNIIFSRSAREFIRKGCEAYLAYILNSRILGFELDQVPTICEFLDVFLEELLSLPPEREVEFNIEVAPKTAPISITMYRMAPAKLKVLKS